MKLNENFRTILNNWISLTLLQIGNFIVPLFLTPYLIMTLGIEAFGILSFALALNVFSRALVSYGFDLTGTKMIAEVSKDKCKVSKIFQDIIYAKLFISIFCLIILIGLIVLVPQFYDYKNIILCYFLIVLSDIFFPVWLYQGMQNMKFITIIKLSSRFIYVILTIYMVNSSDDILYVPIIEGVVSILASIVSLAWAKNKFSLNFALPSYSRIKIMLESSWHVFISKVSVLFYTRFNTILLGLLTSPTIVGYYSVAENIYMAVRSMFNPLIQAIFPYLSSTRVKDKAKYNKLVRISFVSILILLVVLAFLLYSSSEYVLSFLVGDVNPYIERILNIFSVCLVFAVGGFLSTILVIENKGATLSKITFYTVIVNLVLVYPLITYYGAFGLGVCFLIVQIAHFVMQVLANKTTLRSKDT